MHFLLKTANFWHFFLIFSRRCFVEGCGFLRWVQCPKTLNLSYQKQHFKFFTIRGVPYGKKVDHSRKKLIKISTTKNLKYWTKWNRKMGGRSAFGHGLLYIAVHYCTLLYTTVHYCSILYTTVHYCSLPIHYCTLLYTTAVWHKFSGGLRKQFVLNFGLAYLFSNFCNEKGICKLFGYKREF